MVLAGAVGPGTVPQSTAHAAMHGTDGRCVHRCVALLLSAPAEYRGYPHGHTRVPTERWCLSIFPSSSGNSSKKSRVVVATIFTQERGHICLCVCPRASARTRTHARIRKNTHTSARAQAQACTVQARTHARGCSQAEEHSVRDVCGDELRCAARPVRALLLRRQRRDVQRQREAKPLRRIPEPRVDIHFQVDVALHETRADAVCVLHHYKVIGGTGRRKNTTRREESPWGPPPLFRVFSACKGCVHV